MTWWQDLVIGIVVTWPPGLIALYLGRRKLDKVTQAQTEQLTDVTDRQTDWLRPGWTEKHRP